jgi:hypothetical protein
LVFLSDLETSVARVLALRGKTDEALPMVESALVAARQTTHDRLIRALPTAAHVNLSAGRRTGARELLLEFEDRRHVLEMGLHAFLPEAVRTAVALDDAALGSRLLVGIEVDTAYASYAVCASRAVLAEAAGAAEEAAALYSRAATGWEGLGMAPVHAFALLGEGRCLVTLGRTARASTTLDQARALLLELGARPALAEADGLLGRLTALSS